MLYLQVQHLTFRSNDTPISERNKVQIWAPPTWLQLRIQISNVLSNVEPDS